MAFLHFNKLKYTLGIENKMRKDHIATTPYIGSGEISTDNTLSSPLRRSCGSADSDLISYL